mgnify:CR=1 FL=1
MRGSARDAGISGWGEVKLFLLFVQNVKAPIGKILGRIKSKKVKNES